MKKNIYILMIMAAVASLVAGCMPPSADEHPNKKPVPEEPEFIPADVDFGEYGGVKFPVADYQRRELKLMGATIIANNGEKVAAFYSVAPDGSVAAMKKEADDKASITWTGGFDINKTVADAVGIVFYVPAGTYSKGLTVEFTDSDGRILSVDRTGEIVVEAGEEAIVELPVAPVTIYYGKANCYRTDAAGDVKIDITPYYSMAPDLAYENKPAVDKEGKPVAPATSASVVWQLTGTGIEGDVLSGNPTVSGNVLTVPVSGKLGNAVVAIENGGTVLWSYHIWVGPANDVQYNMELDVETGYGAGMGQYKMLDRNLGATSIEPRDQDSYGCFYQWGRKDPFKRLHNLARPAGSPYSTDYESGVDYVDTGETTGTIWYAIKNPGTKIQSANDWHFGTRNNLLWGNPTVPSPSSALYTLKETGIKTPYDPCPEGYRVPDYRYLNMKFTSADECNANYGHLFSTGVEGVTTYYPTGGYIEKNPEKHWVMYLEYRGYYWTSIPGGTGAYSRLVNNNASSKGSGMDRSCACSVRCLKVE